YPLAYLHLSEPFSDVREVPHAEPQVAKRYRPIYKGNVIINAGFDQQKGNKVIEEGDADMVSYGTLFISNPDLPARFEAGADIQSPDKDTYYAGGEKGYIDYPNLREVPAV